MNSNPVDTTQMADQQSQATKIEEAQQDAALQSQNLVETLSEQELSDIGNKCRDGFELDLRSREDWEICLQEWLDLAKQTRENKTFPWPNASNVKYPLLSTAAMQFAARAYPSLVPSNGKIVKTVVIGKDPTGEKFEKSERVSNYMSYQIMHEMDNWEEDMDKMLMMLPVLRQGQ
jgi:chaperonin GroES